MNIEQYQAAANLQIKSTDLSCKYTCRLLLSIPTTTILYYVT